MKSNKVSQEEDRRKQFKINGRMVVGIEMRKPVSIKDSL